MKRLADRFVLRPSTEPLLTNGKARQTVRYGNRSVEVLIFRGKTLPEEEPRLFVLKFSGAGGRAERANDHPTDIWNDVSTEIWAMNPPGYGGSRGPASLKSLAPSARAVLSAIRERAAGRPILVVGNSLGGAIALYLGGLGGVDGLLVRNPPPLRRLIARHHGWWNLWLPAMAVACGVPSELDSVANARRCRIPALFVTSAKDEIVPPKYQETIFHAYGGDHRVFLMHDAQHATPIGVKHVPGYLKRLSWLRQQIVPQ